MTDYLDGSQSFLRDGSRESRVVENSVSTAIPLVMYVLGEIAY